MYDMHHMVTHDRSAELLVQTLTQQQEQLSPLITFRQPHLSSFSLHDPSHMLPCSAYYPTFLSLPLVWATLSQHRSSFPFRPSLFIVHMPAEGQLIWFGTVGNVSTDCSWHTRTPVCVHTHTDNGPFTLSRAEDKQLWIGWKTRWGC